MYVFGLTGGFASGKTTVATMFKELGAKTIDADKLARQVLKPGQPAYQKLVEQFGTVILHSRRNVKNLPLIHRKKLAQLIFSDSKLRDIVNQITHPQIVQESLKKIAYYKKRHVSVVLYEAALLTETGRINDFDGIIVVDLPVDVQKKRALMRGFSEDEIQRRINAQTSREERVKIASFVIDNSGSLENTRRQVLMIWEEITREHKNLLRAKR